MGLTASLNIAQSALSTNAALSSLVSRNIAGVNDANYSRKIGEVITNSAGSASLVSIGRATDTALFNHLLSSTSDAASSKALADGLDQLEQTVSLTDASSSSTLDTTTNDVSPSALIAGLTSALQAYAASPSDATLARSAVASAQSLASGLNQATATVQAVRTGADAGIASAVSSVNTLLGQFGAANAAVMKATATGADATDLLDTRNGILTALSQQMGITTVAGQNNGLSIYTDSGVTLFQGSARTVSFTPTAVLGAGATGNAVMVDGVAVTGASAPMPLKSGTISGLAMLRDTSTVGYQNQLDQIAQGLISTFAETDTSGNNPIAGLFTATGASPTATTVTAGLAGLLKVSPSVDPSAGGVATRLRDGNIGDPANAAYNANPAGNAAYSTHLTAQLAKLDATRAFDASSGGMSSTTLGGYAASSASWLETARKSATATSTSRSAVVSQTTTSLSSATGVNIDDEMSKMLDLENAYKASAQLMQTVSSMFSSLIAAVN